MKALDRKVFRDLKLLWSQALTIALVVASGIGGFVGCLSAVESLSLARDRFYDAGRFGDVFAIVKRAPDAQALRLAELPGVVDVQSTIEAGARVTVPGYADPVIGQLIGLDSHQPRRLNRVSLRSGRLPEPGSRAGGELEAVVAEVFAQAHKLTPGSTVTALVNGKLRRLRITGTVLSPEYIFAGMWGMPDVRAFGVFWLDADELAAALDMKGAFNKVSLRLAPDASRPAAIDTVNRQLLRFGGMPAHGRDDQMSHAMLDNEIREQQILGTILPSIFLAVAAFLLHVVTARLIATQREQVAALKALGYPNRAIALHYLKLVTPMAVGGWLLGLGLAKWLGTMLMGLYDEVFRFPVFVHVMPAELVAMSLFVVGVTALVGTLTAIAATVRLQPAEAMRPPAPGHYRRSLLERVPRLRTGPALRMILRNVERRPLRAAVTVGGIAASAAIIVMGNFFRDAIDVIIDTNFTLGMRGDVEMWTTDPIDAGASRALARLPGVLQVEPGRRVAVRFIHGARTETGVIQGRTTPTSLLRVIDVDGRLAEPPPEGLLVGSSRVDLQACKLEYSIVSPK